MKKTLKQFVFQKMKEQGYILDQEAAKFLGKDKELNFCTVEEYKRQYLSFENAKERFKDIKNPIVEKHRRGYYIRNNEMEEHAWYKIPKSYYEYLKNK